jgi:hypothetical protein
MKPTPIAPDEVLALPAHLQLASETPATAAAPDAAPSLMFCVIGLFAVAPADAVALPGNALMPSATAVAPAVAEAVGKTTRTPTAAADAPVDADAPPR